MRAAPNRTIQNGLLPQGASLIVFRKTPQQRLQVAWKSRGAGVYLAQRIAYAIALARPVHDIVATGWRRLTVWIGRAHAS